MASKGKVFIQHQANRGKARYGKARHGLAWKAKERLLKTIKIRVAELIEDPSIYPREQVNDRHVMGLAEALKKGAKLPPVVADERTKRIVDGFHRCRATIIHQGEGATIECELRSYESDAEMLLDSARLNAVHGQAMSSEDKRAIARKAASLGIVDLGLVAEATGQTVAEVGKESGLLDKRTYEGERETPKASRSRYLKLTPEAVIPLSVYVDDLIDAIENDRVDYEDKYVSSRLGVLGEILATLA